MKFFRCDLCGNVVEVIKDSHMPMSCCGENMTEIIPGTVDASHEKHVPVYVVEGTLVTVNVGAKDHPMTDAHYIEWIMIETNKGVYRKFLTPADKPRAEFSLCKDEKVINVYEYCNMHGLWKAQNY